MTIEERATVAVLYGAPSKDVRALRARLQDRVDRGRGVREAKRLIAQLDAMAESA